MTVFLMNCRHAVSKEGNYVQIKFIQVTRDDYK